MPDALSSAEVLVILHQGRIGRNLCHITQVAESFCHSSVSEYIIGLSEGVKEDIKGAFKISDLPPPPPP